MSIIIPLLSAFHNVLKYTVQWWRVWLWNQTAWACCLLNTWSAICLTFPHLYFLTCKQELVVGMLQVENELEQCLHTARLIAADTITVLSLPLVSPFFFQAPIFRSALSSLCCCCFLMIFAVFWGLREEKRLITGVNSSVFGFILIMLCLLLLLSLLFYSGITFFVWWLSSPSILSFYLKT